MYNNKLCGGNCTRCFISKSPEASAVNKVMRLLVEKCGAPAKKIIEEECPVLAAGLDIQQGNCGGPSRCNDCSVAKKGCGASQQLARLLNRMYVAFGRDAYQIIEGTCPSMTVCPECRIDDFCHVVDDYGNVKCNIERYTLSDFILGARNAGPKDWRAETKEVACRQAKIWLTKRGYIPKDKQVTEGCMSLMCERHGASFDGHGNIVFPE